MLNQLAGTRFKVITGYVDVSALNLAMENDEMRAAWFGTYRAFCQPSGQWVEQGLVKVLGPK